MAQARSKIFRGGLAVRFTIPARRSTWASRRRRDATLRALAASTLRLLLWLPLPGRPARAIRSVDD